MQQNEIYQRISEVYRDGRPVNHRYLSWQHCQLFFDAERKARRPNLDLCSLHLGFYLASWGMYRGSSFLLQKDYLVHKPVVECLLEEQWQPLFDTDRRILKGDTELPEQIWALAGNIRRHYHEAYAATKGREKKDEKDVSATLITKIMMGVMGCTPAYDEFVRACLRENNLTQRFGMKSLREVMSFISGHREVFLKAQDEMRYAGRKYPLMRLADMYFWQSGVAIVAREKSRKEAAKVQ